MKRTRTSLAGVAVVAVLAACGIVVAAAAATTTPSTTVRLYAKAGPVKMHATLNVTLAPATGTQAIAIGQLSSCTVQHTSNPKSGVADKLNCTTASGQHVVVPATMTAATLTYKLHSSTGQSSTQGMTVQIRHGSSVIETLAPGTATITLPTGHTAAMVNGRDTLYVIAGSHTYHGKITVVK